MSSRPVHISKAMARTLAIRPQLPVETPNAATGKEAVAQTIERLGYIQIDTISVVQRAHHHALWIRHPDYDPAMLHALQADDRRVFEYSGHAASYLPMRDYRFYLPKMQGHRNSNTPSAQRMRERSNGYLELVLERIRNEGPLASKDFKPEPGETRGPWWDWKPTKVALEVLFWRGDLMVAERRGFQRFYDLTERVLPPDVDTRLPDEAELGRFLVRRALAAHGIARPREIWDHIRSLDFPKIEQALAELTDAGEVATLTVEDQADAPYYALAEQIEASLAANTLTGQVAQRVLLLSPFDNLIILRDRVRDLFDFDYTIECYTPAAKRQYGYFTFPILWGDRLVGRLDPKAERKARRLVIRNLVFEPGFAPDAAFLAAFAQAVRDFAAFNKCDTIFLEAVEPASDRAALLAALSA